ncbi:MAG: energy-coupling factor transporter transmembrane protein EcfT, partial [Nitrospinae bacterium]|nr:energy-coupling factor transporter transmembrane protein EcfT [Nitrospinota bacterium]
MNLSLYLDNGTWIHRLDARTKILWLLGLFVLSLMFSDPGFLLGMMGLVLGTTIMAKSLANVKRIWVLLVLLFVYSLILWPFFVEGKTPLLEIGTQVITLEGVMYGLGMGLRLNVMLLSGIFMLSTTAIEEFTQGLHRLGVPHALA